MALSSLCAIGVVLVLLAGLGSVDLLPPGEGGPVPLRPASGPILAEIVPTATNGSIPLNVSFAGSATGGWTPYAYSWTFGDGSPPVSGSSASHTFRWVADFEVNLTVSDSNSQTTTVSVVIHATAAPLVVAVASVPSVVHVGNSTYLESSVHGGTPPYTYRWSGLPAGCVALPVENLSCSPTAGGTFEVNLTVTDSVGARSNGSALLLVTGGSSTLPAGGISMGWEPWLLIGGAGLIVAMVTVGLWVRRRRTRR